MKDIGLKVEDLDQFFQDLLHKCQCKECYSVIETVEKMGMFYHKVKEWAHSNENWSYTLELCRTHCYYHAEEGSLNGEISEQEGIKYMNENRNSDKNTFENS